MPVKNWVYHNLMLREKMVLQIISWSISLFTAVSVRMVSLCHHARLPSEAWDQEGYLNVLIAPCYSFGLNILEKIKTWIMLEAGTLADPQEALTKYLLNGPEHHAARTGLETAERGKRNDLMLKLHKAS